MSPYLGRSCLGEEFDPPQVCHLEDPFALGNNTSYTLGQWVGHNC